MVWNYQNLNLTQWYRTDWKQLLKCKECGFPFTKSNQETFKVKQL